MRDQGVETSNPSGADTLSISMHDPATQVVSGRPSRARPASGVVLSPITVGDLQYRHDWSRAVCLWSLSVMVT
jgi:hypothetical protein